MNIKDSVSEEIKGCKLIAIFNRQEELMEKYHHIEAKSGLCQTEDCPVNLHDMRGQARLKDFSWRVTEEVAEAMEALPQIARLIEEQDNLDILTMNKEEYYDKMLKISQEIEDHLLHFKEELVDALHFLTEKTILEGLKPNSLVTLVETLTHIEYVEDTEDYLDYLFRVAETIAPIRGLEEEYADFITHLGLTCNCLKNKPWKQSQMATDTQKYFTQASKTWVHFIRLLIVSGLSPQSTADFYLKKSQVNKFRQRSNY